MEDRELLELAAKAAGISIYWKGCAMDLSDFSMGGECGPYIHGSGVFFDSKWNPLTDDGDALRLLHAIYRKSHVDHWISVYDNLWGGSLDDMRRAIVRAAADIGKTM